MRLYFNNFSLCYIPNLLKRQLCWMIDMLTDALDRKARSIRVCTVLYSPLFYSTQASVPLHLMDNVLVMVY